MSDIAERYGALAAGFLARIEATPREGWGRASPCRGWTAQDVVAHVINGHRGSSRPAARTLPTPIGTVAVQEAVDAIGALELLVHTWDLARAVGGDETLDSDTAARTYDTLRPHHAALQDTGAFQPHLPPPAGADPQTMLLCLTGRHP